MITNWESASPVWELSVGKLSEVVVETYLPSYTLAGILRAPASLGRAEFGNAAQRVVTSVWSSPFGILWAFSRPQVREVAGALWAYSAPGNSHCLFDLQLPGVVGWHVVKKNRQVFEVTPG